MEEPLSQEEIIEYELEEGEIREEEDFATEEEYRAYNIIRSYYANKSAISAYGAKKKTNANFAKPVNKPIKTSPLGKNNIQYKITKLKRNLAIQAYTLVGNELYVTQRNGETVYLTRCILSNKKKKTYIAKNEMKLVGFAHGQTLEAFVYDGETYLLVGANSQYGFARSIAFLKFNKTKNSKIVYGKDEYKKDYYEITKLSYANQKNKYFGTVRRIDAALSNDNKTLGVWTVVGAMTTDDEGKKRIVFKKIQIGCFKFKKILSYFEKHSKQRSLSFKSMKKNEGWCYYSCEQNKKSQFIRPGGSNQGIEVSNRYYVKDDNGNKIWKNKIYFSAGNENDGIPLYIGMMTIKNKSNKDLTKNGSYRTQLRIKIKKLDDVHKNYDYKEMEGLHIEGTSNSKIWFVITPSGEYKGTKAKKKKLQYIYSIPRKTLNGSKKK